MIVVVAAQVLVVRLVTTYTVIVVDRISDVQIVELAAFAVVVYGLENA